MIKAPLIPQDKANHAVYGAVIFAAGYIAAQLFPIAPLLLAGLAVSAVAAGKEIYDRVSGTGTPDPRDFVATVAGAVPVALVAFVATGAVSPL